VLFACGLAPSGALARLSATAGHDRDAPGDTPRRQPNARIEPFYVMEIVKEAQRLAAAVARSCT